MDGNDSEKVSYILEKFNNEFINYNDFDKEINDFFEKNVNDMSLSDAGKKVTIKSKQIIENSLYETDMKLFEISKLQILWRTAKDENEKEFYRKQVEKFYKENPKYVTKQLPVLNDDGSLNDEEVKKMNAYRQAYEKMIILKHFDEFNGMTKEQLAQLPEKDRKHIIITAFAALKYREDPREDEREFANDAIKIIKQLEPELDLNNEEELANFFEKLDGRKMNLKTLSLKEMIDIYSRQISVITENYIEKNQDSFINGKEIDFSDLNMDYGIRNIYDSTMKNYFIGSKIKFTEKDEEFYNKMNQEFTIGSWIENKDDAIRLRYTALLDMRKKYQKLPNNEFIAKKIYNIEEEIKKFEKEFGKVSIEPKKGEMVFELYKQYFVNAGLTRYLSRDAMEWQDGVNYESLNDNHKKGYIRNVLVALEHEDMPDFCITKLALRRLELMNSSGKQFITFDNNGGYRINKELILQEYNRMSSHTYSDYKELTESAKLRKDEYLLRKLEEYTHLRDRDFVELEDKENLTRSMQQINEARYLSNQKGIHEMIQEGRINADKNIIANSPYETDMHLFEISKLHIMLKDPKNVENTQMYSIMLAKIKDFYKQHPEYIKRKIPVLNSDGTLNENEIDKMNQYSEAYQRIVILHHLDIANGYDIDKISDDEKKDILICAFAGLKYRNSKDIEIREISEESMKIIKELYPNLDLNNENDLAKFFVNEMGFSGKVDSISLDELISINSLRLKEATESYIEKDRESYVDKKIDLSTLDFDSSKRKIYSSVMKNYFVGSRIKFTENDEQRYNELYQRATVESWIENKENAIKLRYAALTTIRDEYKNNPSGSYTERKLIEIEKAIEEFENKYGKVNLAEKKGEVPFEEYREDFINAGVTKFLTRDASDWSEGVNYTELDDEHKKGYIRNLLVALENKDNPTYLTKIALRRLELMNSEGKEFVKFNEKGGFKINEELILEEYRSMSKYKYTSYEELVQSAKLRKNEYLLKKLEEYTYLDDKDFLKLDNKKDLIGSMEKIEKARYKSNQKRIHEMAIPERRKKTTEPEKISDNDISRALTKGKVVEESVNTAGVINMRSDDPRSVMQRNQEEASDDNTATDTTGSEKKSAIEVGNIDVSTTKDKPPKFIDMIKIAFKNIKDRIKKVVKGEDETLALNAPNDDAETNELTSRNNNSGYDFNKQYNIDHNLANSGKNTEEKSPKIHGTELEERDSK